MEATARHHTVQARADANRRHVRVLLAIREPELSAVLTHASTLPCGPENPYFWGLLIQGIALCPPHPARLAREPAPTGVPA